MTQGRETEDAANAGLVWEAEKYALERLLVRTTFAAEGQDLELDKVLSQLRDAIRGGHADPAQLKHFLELLDLQLIASDERKSRLGERLRSVLSRLIRQSRQPLAFQAELNALKRLEKSVKRPATVGRQLADWLDELADLQARAFAADPHASPHQGLLSKLFGGSRTTAPLTTTTATRAAAEPASDELQLSVNPGEDADQRVRFARRVSELLDHLLIQVSLSPTAQVRAMSVRSRLAEGQDWDELRDALNETTELIIAAVSRSQLEFESFLTRLDERLQSLQSHFSNQSEASELRKNASQALEWQLVNDLRGLGDDIRCSGDFEDLKLSVSHHIESIAGAITGYRQDESQREAQLSEQMDVMRTKLAAVEAYSEQMQEQLRLERSRALTDVLTQLPNREAWQERLAFEYARWQRYGNPVTLCVLDIDLFKRINDSFGHKAGDRVIQLLARALRERLRATDFVARYGGEEFVILLPETEMAEAQAVINQLRQYIAELPFHFQSERVTITCSIGLAPFQLGDDADAVFDHADKALYRAKAAGRNRLEVADVQ